MVSLSLLVAWVRFFKWRLVSYWEAHAASGSSSSIYLCSPVKDSVMAACGWSMATQWYSQRKEASGYLDLSWDAWPLVTRPLLPPVKWGGGVSSFFPVNKGVRQGCVCAPSLSNSCILGTGQSCGLKSLWSICRQYQDHWSCFYWWCSNLHWVTWRSWWWLSKLSMRRQNL